jgi:hypothetical protein
LKYAAEYGPGVCFSQSAIQKGRAREGEMTDKRRKTRIRLKLTECQQAQIRQVTGREVTSLELRLHSLPEPPEPARGQRGTSARGETR